MQSDGAGRAVQEIDDELPMGIDATDPEPDRDTSIFVFPNFGRNAWCAELAFGHFSPPLSGSLTFEH
jgi:hypothetical protein